MKSELFPKKQAIATVALTLIIVIGELMVINANMDTFSTVNKKHIPLLERSAINVRLSQMLMTRVENYLHSKDSKVLDLYTIELESLKYNMDEYKASLSEFKDKEVQDNVKYLNRSKVDEIEKTIINLIKNKNYYKAKSLFNSEEYQMHIFTFTDAIQDITEHLAYKRDLDLDRKKKMAYLSFISIIVLTFFMAFAWLSIYQRFQKNIRLMIETEEILAHERAAAEHTAKMASLGEMAAGIAHEINNPITIIIGQVTLLKKKFDSGNLDAEYFDNTVEKIKKTAFRISKIIKGLRNFSRDTKYDDYSEFKISELIEDTLVLCEKKLLNSNVELIKKNCESKELIYGQETELQQVLLNLINNAFDAMKDSGMEEMELKIEVDEDGFYNYIKVADSGPGVPSEIQDKIFQPFFTTKEVGKGTGLGLSISSNILMSHSGQLYIDKDAIMNTFIMKIPKYIPKENKEESDMDDFFAA